jgi:hypothetical protein
VNPALGPFAIAAVLLVVAGALKVVHPDDTALALRGVGLPANRAVVRLGGLVEGALGLMALVTVGALIAAMVAASYALFCGFVGIALVKHAPIATCGCFGKVDAPPSLVHLGLSLGAVVAAIGMAADTTLSPVDLLSEAFTEAAAYVLLVLVGAVAAFVAMTWLPRALAESPQVPVAH